MIWLPESVWRDTVEVFRSCGRGRRECVAYWVGPVLRTDEVTRVVHPLHTGTPCRYEVDGSWLTGFSVELTRAMESVRVQVHTHGGIACHSPTDDAGAIVYQEGFLSLVLPWFAMRRNPRDGAFLAELNDAGVWREVAVEDRLEWR